MDFELEFVYYDFSLGDGINVYPVYMSVEFTSPLMCEGYRYYDMFAYLLR